MFRAKTNPIISQVSGALVTALVVALSTFALTGAVCKMLGLVP